MSLTLTAPAGVLNTDNMSIVGATLDYGPYGFMNRQVPCSNPCCLPRQHHNTVPQAGLHNLGVNCSALKAKSSAQGSLTMPLHRLEGCIADCTWHCTHQSIPGSLHGTSATQQNI